uniref:Transposon protein, putative, unclassified n=1 Tax=Oryza sativa subsp. japonica TaxID=39947 RepID=Q2QUM0_ORYSJ|nr:transposon protein, putative, unclassified [Oryza sativa Japonica Group]
MPTTMSTLVSIKKLLSRHRWTIKCHALRSNNHEFNLSVLPRNGTQRQPQIGGGCRASTPTLRDVRRPKEFRPGAIEKYGGSTDPEEFLQVYPTILYTAGADDNALANYLPATLKGSARSWLQFITNFQGTYKRHAIEDDLHALTQNPGESLRDYIRCFNEYRNTIPEITDASVIHAFKSSV